MPFAIAAAIPVIEKIIQTIFPQHAEKNIKGPTKDAINRTKAESSTALKLVGDELTTISTLLEQCLPAEDGMVTIKAVLDGNEDGELTHADLAEIGRAWKTVTQNLSRIDKVKLDGISDTSTKRKFLDIINADTNATTQAIADSKDADTKTKIRAQKELATSMSGLHKALLEVNLVAGTVIGEIASELIKLSEEQKGGHAAAGGSK